MAHQNFSELPHSGPGPNCDDVIHTLQTYGLDAALNYLNVWVPHRFTAVFKLEGALFVCKSLFDKTSGMTAADQQPLPYHDSFCKFVVETGPFLTLDADLSERAKTMDIHHEIKSYMGIPLYDNASKLWGTLSHFDYVPHAAVTLDQYDFLKQCGHHIEPIATLMQDQTEIDQRRVNDLTDMRKSNNG